ncbi:DUF1573 domain-containing protein [bacterium]|nr:DUF1573 domain-containing protein [bacterium]
MRFTILLVMLAITGPSLFADDAVSLTPALIDHGKVRMGVVVEDTIRIFNPGPAALVIGKVTATCGCTATGAGSRTVAPGDTAVIPYFFNTRGFKGVVRKQITVHIGGQDPLVYTFQLQVVEEITVEPRYHYLPGIEAHPDTSYMRTVTLGNFSDRPISITSVQTNSDQVKVYPARADIPRGESRLFKIRYIPAVRKDSHYTILFHTDYDPLPEIKVPFYVTYK